jgi:hypothetical protein
MTQRGGEARAMLVSTLGQELMTEKKKRQKVVAELTLAHLMQLAQEAGHSLSQEEAIALLNQDGRAYAMWKHMMRAGEEYFKSTLQRPSQSSIPIRASERRRLAV